MLFLIATAACQATDKQEPGELKIWHPPSEVRALSSGEKVLIFSIATQHLGGELTLVIDYGTRLDPNDVEGRMREADTLWPEFSEDVANSGLNRVHLSQSTINESGELAGSLSGVIYTRNTEGVWCRVSGIPYEGMEDRCFPAHASQHQ